MNGYIIRRLSTDDMTKSNRFNPLFYIRSTSDILVVVNTLLENTREGSGKDGTEYFDFYSSINFTVCGHSGV